MAITFPSLPAWLAANAVGIALFEWAGSALWFTGCEMGPADGLIFLLFAFPFLVLFGFVHVVGFWVAAGRALHQRRYRQHLSWLAATALCWVAAVAFWRFMQGICA